MKYKVGDMVRIKTNLGVYESDKCYVTKGMIDMEGEEHIIEEVDCTNHNCKISQSDGKDYWWFAEEMLEPVAPTLAEIKEKKLTCVVHTKTKREADMLFKAVDSYDHNGKTWASWWDVYKEKTCYRTYLGEVVAYGCIDNYIEDGEKVIEFSDLVATGGYCNGFRGGKKPEYSDNIMATAESISDTTGISYENSINKLKTCLSAFSNDGISAKNGGKNSMKFTFYFNVNEGTRVDKSCNGTIPTITTSVVLDKFGDPDRRKCYSLEGEATCDKADYDMRQGVLEALANAVFDGNFEKAYDKAVKTNAFCERQDRTCHYCGKVLDTIEEKQTHEAWHVERKKARRERYLLRKRAKEIAFEEQAQKMAKEIISEDNKK